jgi:ribosomal peptide maturation radical SAM protein 1
MYRIALVNMPFAGADMPSIGLTQLRSVIQSELGEQVRCDVLYLNLEFVGYLGPHFYRLISDTVQANTSGLGDWFFSHEAFPEKPDESDAYLIRHFSEHRAQLDAFKGQLSSKRREVGAFLDRLALSYRLDSYPMVGFTTMFSQNLASFAMARRLKQIHPEVVTLIGGPNCETPMGEVIARRVPGIDFVFSGPGLATFPCLVRHILAGEEEECHRIKGVLSRRKLASMPDGASREIGDEIDIATNVPLDYDDYFATLDSRVPKEANIEVKVPFETSRGCWWGERSHCTFCGLNGATMGYRALPAQQALDLLHGLFDRYAERAVEFKAVDNILPREYLTDVLPYLETPESAVLFYEIKADLKQREMAVLAQARVKHIQPGIEALSTASLKLMRKGTTSFQNLKFLKHCGRYGVKALWNLLVGFPTEPEAVYQKYCEDLPLLVHLEPPSGVYPIRFDRFSPYFTRAKDYGLKLKPYKFYEMIYPFSAADLADLAYYFSDEEYQAPYLVNTARWLAKMRACVAQWHVRWQRRDRRLQPELTLKERRGATVVYDSRSGAAVEHTPSPLALRILDLLEDQHRLGRLVERLPGVSERETAAQVAWLKQRGLLFEEDGLYLSLVVKPESRPVLAVVQQGEAVREVGLG